MAQWYAQIGGQRYGPASEEVMKSWIAQGRVKPTDYVWSDGMPNWVTADVAMGQASAGGADPADSANPAAQPAVVDPIPQRPRYGGSPPLGNAPGAVSSMVCGIIGTALAVPCCGFLSFIPWLAGLPLGIVAIVQAKKAKVLLAAYPDMYGGQGMATAGYILGIIALALDCLCLLVFVAYVIFMGTSFIPMLQNRKF
jgi:hypothetical protein